MRKIGFSHGVLFKVLDVNTEESINILAASGASAIEINCHRSADSGSLNNLLPYIKKFERVSLHVPCNVRYGNNDETILLLKDLEDFYKKSGAELAVVHPDVVDDWTVFDSFDMNFAIENLDDRKERFKDVADLKEFFNAHPKWGFVLDVGHCNSNDKSMVLAENMIKEFKERVVEIHLSGYKVFHDPLHRTKQTEIINYCKEFSVPIIIESVFEVSDGVEGVKKEFDYITENLNKMLICIKDYKIRNIVPDDILALHNVYLTTWLATYPNQEFNITKEDIEYKYEQALLPEKLAERKNKISQKGENQTMLLVEYNNKVVGLCNAIVEDDDNQLQAIYVLPTYQGLGLGRALWEEAKKSFDPKKDTIVHVASYNEKAINFYQKMGFVSTGKIFFDERFKMRNGAMIPELEMIIKKKK